MENGRRELRIVIRENGKHNGKGFDVFLDGDIERIGTFEKEDDMSPAEFWGSRLFGIVRDVLADVGAIKTVTPRSPGHRH